MTRLELATSRRGPGYVTIRYRAQRLDGNPSYEIISGRDDKT